MLTLAILHFDFAGTVPRSSAPAMIPPRNPSQAFSLCLARTPVRVGMSALRRPVTLSLIVGARLRLWGRMQEPGQWPYFFSPASILTARRFSGGGSGQVA